jgi:hypothetical protein
MSARTSDGRSVEVLAVGTAVRFVGLNRRLEPEERSGRVTAWHWQGDTFHCYVVDEVHAVYPANIVSHR